MSEELGGTYVAGLCPNCSLPYQHLATPEGWADFKCDECGWQYPKEEELAGDSFHVVDAPVFSGSFEAKDAE
jgi:hypothetical protein